MNRNLPKGAKTFSLSFEDQSTLQMLYLFQQHDRMHLEATDQQIVAWKMSIIQRFAIDPNVMDIDLSAAFDPHKPEVHFIPKPQPTSVSQPAKE